MRRNGIYIKPRFWMSWLLNNVILHQVVQWKKKSWLSNKTSALNSLPTTLSCRYLYEQSRVSQATYKGHSAFEQIASQTAIWNELSLRMKFHCITFRMAVPWGRREGSVRSIRCTCIVLFFLIRSKYLINHTRSIKHWLCSGHFPR